MSNHASITVLRSREEVERLWNSDRPAYVSESSANVRFADAPGGRGTEIHVELSSSGGIGRLLGGPKLAKIKDELRRFKQRVETGEVPRSDATPEGEHVERKLKQRPAQPLPESELEKVGV